MIDPTARRRCIFCHGPLPPNDALEHFPLGSRVAYDPDRGRLWAVCGSCARWNLAPIEERWEALEELERGWRDHGRVLASTDTIALIRIPGLDVVRVGGASLPEEAWWRYGADMVRRRSRYRALQWAGRAATLVAWGATGGAFYVFGAGNSLNRVARWYRFGSSAWRGETRCGTCGSPLYHLTFRQIRRLYLTKDADGDPALHLRCSRCGSSRTGGEHRIEGVEADHLLRRVVTYHHFSGASERQVSNATAYIDRLGSPAALTSHLLASGLRMDALLLDRERRTQAVALEIALNDENERLLLGMELGELEARWREEEEIAAIVDGELTPVGGLERLRQALRPSG